MSYFNEVIFHAREERQERLDERRRQQAIDETRCSAKLGAQKLPLAVVMDETLSDTCINRLLDVHDQAAAERERDRHENPERSEGATGACEGVARHA